MDIIRLTTIVLLKHVPECLLKYLLQDQSVQLLDVRSNESVKSEQDLVFWQRRQQETQRLHQPHALAALRAHTHI